MAIAWDGIIRGGSGLLLVLLGVVVLVASRRGWREVALATYLVSFGTPFALQNGARMLGLDPEAVDPISTPLYALQVVALVALLGAHLPDAAAALRWRARAATIVVALGFVVWGTLRDPSSLLADLLVVDNNVPPLFAAAWAAVLALGFEAASGRERRHSALLAAGAAIYPAYDAGFSLRFASYQAVELAEQPLFLGLALLLGVAVVLWLRAAARVAPASALGRNVALAMAGAATIGYLLTVLVPPDDVDTTGGIGVARILGAACIAWAILRHDLLGIGLQPRTIRRGTLAAGALASLFIVAQVAQNFLEAQYGLLMGGIVAGAFLFAASPIQRAIEGRAPGPAPAPGPGGDDRLETYREAVRFALRDRAMTRREERHLAKLAQHLGLGAADALQVRHEVEDESTAPQ